MTLSNGSERSESLEPDHQDMPGRYAQSMLQEPSWSAPAAAGPVDSAVALPGSKSMTNRALVLGAIADEPTLVRGPLRSRDTVLMVDALRALGKIDEIAEGDWRVTPGKLTGPATLDVGRAGTVMRFVPPIAALANGAVAFDGDQCSRKRPMGLILAALRALGAAVDGTALPFTLGGRLRPRRPGHDRRLRLLAARLRPAAGRPPYDKGVEVHRRVRRCRRPRIWR